MSLNRIEAIREKIRALEDNIRDAEPSVLELSRALERYLSVARRLNLPENVEQQIRILNQLKIAILTAYRAYVLFQAGTPYGWLIGGASLAMGGFMFADIMYSEVENG